MRYIGLICFLGLLFSCKSYQAITKPGNYTFKTSVAGAQFSQSLKGIFSIDSSSLQMILFGPLNIQVGRALIRSQEIVLVDLFNKRIFFIELANAYQNLNSLLCRKISASEQEILQHYLVCLFRVIDKSFEDNEEIYTVKCDKNSTANCLNVQSFENRKSLNNILVNNCGGLITDVSFLIKKKQQSTSVMFNLEKYKDFKRITIHIDE